ncbi:MAG TPA: hypothetical protein VE868_12920, partial [Balneolaceae bacterium]|nr:hypothetical protein [Balneolaceae bacterium]
DPRHYNALYWFINRALKWQQADEEVKSLEKKISSYENDIEKALKKCSQLTQKYSLPPVGDSSGAKARFKQLRDQENKREDAQEKIAAREKIIREKDSLIQRKKSDVASIYQKLKVEVDQKDEIRALLDLLEKYNEAKQEVQVSRQRLAEAKNAMENHSGYASEKARIEELKLDQAKDIVAECKEKAGELEKINQKITEIETKINSKKEGNSLENALGERDEALLNLKQRYNENLSSVTGQLLVDHLKDKMREQNRPPVFSRANQLFNRITKGHYSIEINEQTEQFIAYDTLSRVNKKLSELSTGTRIQLLLSVRLAFIEMQESALKLPILADELLANSDDRRAQAVIEALTEISRDGRQIFYFTAQNDEVSKWQWFLADAETVDFKIFTLQNGHEYFNRRDREVPDVPDALSFFEEVPPANGHTHASYGNELNIHPYNLLLDKPSQLHLWYLIDDLKVLHRCLSRQIERWGQLESIIQHSGTIEGLDEEQFNRLKEKVQLLSRFQSLYQRGRPRPIDRSVLEATSAVTENFIDEVSASLQACKGDPEKLLKSLRKGDVSGFRSRKIEELESYLLNKNFISTHSRLNEKEIKEQMQANISNSDISPQEAQKLFNRILNREQTE